MNELRKAEIYSSKIEKGYTCIIGLKILDENGRSDFLQSFGGRKFYTDEDYETWKNSVENITNRRFEDSVGARIKTIISDNEYEGILAIGSQNESYWIERVGKEYFIRTKKVEIEDMFKRYNIEVTKGKMGEERE